MKLFEKKIENYFMHSALLLLQNIQILMKTISFSINYGNFCMCTKHFGSHCMLDLLWSMHDEWIYKHSQFVDLAYV